MRTARRRPSSFRAEPWGRESELPYQDPDVVAELPRPDAMWDDVAAVALCMNALARNDEPCPDAGLTVCFSFSSDMCRAAVGGSLEEFRKYNSSASYLYARQGEIRAESVANGSRASFNRYARNPTFSQLINCKSW